jgi:hypothetical protein
MINTWERLLTTYAYNILGSYEDAKDVVQDAYLVRSFGTVSGKYKVKQAAVNALQN